MKRKFFLWALIVAFAGFASCSDDDEVVPPTPTPDPDPQPQIEDARMVFESTTIDVAAEGGDVVVKFTIENPRTNSNMMYSTESEWLDAIAVVPGETADKNQACELQFKAAANESEQARESTIELSYSSAEDVILTIRQAGVEPEPEPEQMFQVELTQIGKTEVYAKITPKNNAITYFKFVMSASQMALYPDDQALYESEMMFFQQQCQQFNRPLDEILFAFHREGVNEEKCDTHYFEQLVPDNDYFVYVYGLNIENGELTTPITRAPFRTEATEKVNVNFKFDYKVDGTRVPMTITPEGYDGYFIADVYSGVDENTDKKVVIESLLTTWMNIRMNYSMYGFPPEMILQELAQKGIVKKNYELSPNQKWMLAAFALDAEALPCSEIAMEFFQTGNLTPSSNEITITVSEVTAHKAKLTFEPSNDDIYTAAILTDEELQASGAQSDREIMKWCIQNKRMEGFNGRFETVLQGLVGNANYHVFAFGCVGGEHITTPLFRADFTTPEEKFIESDLKMIYDKYYDLEEVIALDSQFAGFAGQGEVILPAGFTLTTEGVTPMWSIFRADEVDAVTDEVIVDALKQYSYQSSAALLLFYDVPYKVVAMCMDAEGNRTKVWKSEPLTLTKAGTSPAQEFIDMMNPKSAKLARLASVAPRKAAALEIVGGQPLAEVEVVKGEWSEEFAPVSFDYDPARMGEMFVRKALNF